MLVSGLEELVSKHQELGVKLMGVLARASFEKGFDDCRHFRNVRLPVAIEWRTELMYGEEDGSAHLLRLLVRYGMSESRAAELCRLALFYEFSEGDVVVQPLTSCTHLLVLLSGSLLLEQLATEVSDEAILHASEYLAGAAPVTSLLRVRATSPRGLLAGFRMEKLHSFLGKRGGIAHDLLLLVGKFEMALTRAIGEVGQELTRVNVRKRVEAAAKGKRRKRKGGEKGKEKDKSRRRSTNMLIVDATPGRDSFVKKNSKLVNEVPPAKGPASLQRVEKTSLRDSFRRGGERPASLLPPPARKKASTRSGKMKGLR